MTDRVRIVVAGLAALYPVGGVAWDYLQYVIGLSRLGHDVWYYEDTSTWPYHPVERRATDDASYSIAYLSSFFARYAPDLLDRWHYVHLHDEPHGVSRADFRDVLRTADVFLNVSGASVIPDDLGAGAIRAFVDTDPGYNQILLITQPSWSPNVGRWAASVDAHNVHLTYAENIGAPDCGIPATGHVWQPTRMPIVLDLWKSRPARRSTWTTVLTWNDFKGPLVLDEVAYGSKDAEFLKLLNLPRQANVPLEVALGGKAPVETIAAAGWQIVDGPDVTRSPHEYQQYLATSRGELSPAKQVYVALRTGWFSCRTACYLALGVPAVVQDTAFSRFIPTGAGLMSFNSPDEAIAGIAAVEGDYARHAQAASELAREHFDSATVLAELLSRVGSPTCPAGAIGASPDGWAG